MTRLKTTVADLAAAGRSVVEDAGGQLRAVLGPAPVPAPPDPPRPAFLPKPRKPRAPLRERLLALLGWRRTRPRRRLEPEEIVQTQAVAAFDRAFAQGRKVLLVSLSNETRLPMPGEAEAARSPEAYRQRIWLQKVAEEFGRLQLAMGLLKGAPDTILPFVHRETGLFGVGFMEFKRPGGDPYIGRQGDRVVRKTRTAGRVSPEQEAVLELLAAWGAPVGVARSVDEAFALARGWGADV